VGSRWESKRWFAEQIASCAKLIRERYGLAAVLLGSKEDARSAREVEISCGQGIINLAGLTSLKEAIGIIAKAEVAVGPDTGLMHIAAAVRTPVVSLWGATSPFRAGPYGFENLVIQGRAACVPCYRKHCPIGRICMRSIGSDEILERIDMARLLKRDRTSTYGIQP
jgi:ADP-heptose:LPS heptosyltransferase